MARPASSKRSSAKKTPAKGKRGTAPSRKVAKPATRSGAPKGAAQTKGKPKTESASSRKGSAKAPQRSPAASAKRAGRAQATKRGQAAARDEGRGTKTPGAHGPERVEVRNVNVPGYRTTVDARKYEAMRSTLLSVLPRGEPGLTQSEMFDAVRGKLPEDVFPGQQKAEWWVKCVQLDQEARGAMKRSATKPLRWRLP